MQMNTKCSFRSFDLVFCLCHFKAKFSFFTSLSAAETHVFGVKFIGLYGTVVFIAIRDFSC